MTEGAITNTWTRDGGTFGRGMVPLFAFTMGMSALLLFSVQPMFTRMVLPLLGGSAAVWNTAVVFFQAMLLLGYLYAHLLARLKSLGVQAALHLVLLALAFLLLPVALPEGWRPPAGASPVPWLLGLLAFAVGVPFLAISATAPLLQRWFAATGHEHAGDPYFLYGASNLGSLLALLGYPLVIEPALGLGGQSAVWTWGFSGLVVLIAVTALTASRRSVGRRTAEAPHLFGRLDWAVRGRWIALSAVPSSLLLGVTLHISTNVAAAPFMWVVPLALYLATFVIVFSKRWSRRPRRGLVDVQTIALIPLAAYFWTGILWLNFAIHLAGFFVTALLLHAELARRRPAAADLTEFYLWISVGGFVGGAATVLIAPLIFDNVIEYPLALVLACLLRPGAWGGGSDRRALDFLLPGALALLFLVPGWLGALTSYATGQGARLAIVLVVAVAVYIFRARPLRLGLGLLAAIFVPEMVADTSHTLTRERSFFGVHRVEEHAGGRMHLLRHGTIVHGIELMVRQERARPLAYYSRGGPLGQVFQAMGRARRVASIGVVGLGSGAVACHGRPWQSITFFEIDPVVERLARDTRYFHFLDLCPARVVIGDGRLSLAEPGVRPFDILIIDAFSSDAIPVHLMTREALALYVSRLATGGVLMFHISNRFLDLEPVLANLVADGGLSGLIQKHRLGADEPVNVFTGTPLVLPSDWVVIARAPEDLAFLGRDGRWRALGARPHDRPWTDDYTNVFGALMWRN